VTDKPHVWVVTTTFDRPEKLKAYIDCLSQQTWQSFTLVLVDHGIEPIRPDINFSFSTVILRADPSLWWTAAVNTGIRAVLQNTEIQGNDFVLLQNDDSTFGPDFISSLVMATNNSFRVVGSVVVDRNNGRVLHANLKFHRLRARYMYLHRGVIPEDLGVELLPADVLKGRGVIYPVSVVRRIGLLDERLPQYRSDHEWANRARRLGFDICVTPLAICETIIDTQERIVIHDPMRSFWRVLFGRRSPANLRDMVVYFFTCFGPVLAAYCVFVNGLRTILVSTLQMSRALLRCWKGKRGVSEST